MTYSEFERTFAALASAFPQREIPTATQLIYWEDLHELDAALFAAAARKARRACDWFPTIKQLLDAADAIAAKEHGILTPDEAWAQVAAVASGWYDGQSVRDLLNFRAFNAVQAIGGIRTIATANDAGVAGKRRDFLHAYQSAYDMAVTMGRTIPLPPENERVHALRDVA